MSTDQKKKKKKIPWRWIFILGVALIVVLFALNNSDPIELSLVFTKTTAPLSVIVLASFFIGFLVGLIFWGLSGLKHRKELKNKDLEIRLLEDRLTKVQEKLVDLHESAKPSDE